MFYSHKYYLLLLYNYNIYLFILFAETYLEILVNRFHISNRSK